MNIELKPIAEKKIRQLGGDVCGVLVRTDGGVMAVSEHGRCTRLDGGVMGPVDGAQGGQGAEVVAWCWENHGRHVNVDKSFAKELIADGEIVRPLVYGDTQPQPAVPEGWKEAAMGAKRFADDMKMVMLQPLTAAAHIRGLADLILTTPTTPQADAWVRCEDRVHAKCGGRVVGRMRDGDSVSCEKCGRTGHVLIDDGGIDIDWTPAGQEGEGDERL